MLRRLIEALRARKEDREARKTAEMRLRAGRCPSCEHKIPAITSCRVCYGNRNIELIPQWRARWEEAFQGKRKK